MTPCKRKCDGVVGVLVQGAYNKDKNYTLFLFNDDDADPFLKWFTEEMVREVREYESLKKYVKDFKYGWNYSTVRIEEEFETLAMENI